MDLRDGLQTHVTVRQRYDHLVELGNIRRDLAQLAIVAALDRLIYEISYKKLARKSSALRWLFAKRKTQREPVKGLYVHGGVGHGKTMLMHMFFELAPVKHKRRVHFNDFMTDVHDRIQKQLAARKNSNSHDDDHIPRVAAALAEEAWVLCFDEFSVTDIADAMILSRLFSALFALGIVLVATSNVAPKDLYRDGLNRQLFLPFIDILEQNTAALNLNAETDYRLEKLDRLPVYLTPLGDAADHAMDKAWARMANGAETKPATVAVKGRKVAVPAAVNGCARFSFADLCEKPLAARDYLAITAKYSTIFIDHVPILAEANRNEAKRFILLIDTLYDQHVMLVVSAAAMPDKLYAGKRGHETFEFDRTSSRLIEMQRAAWFYGCAERQAESAASLAG